MNHNAVLLQLPLGLESTHQGVIDLVTMKALRFEGEHGDEVIVENIPPELLGRAEEAREQLLDAASLFSDELTEAILEERVTEELLHDAIRRGTLALEMTPVLVGSAYKNKGVQPLLDAVCRYLPGPVDTTTFALDLDQDEAEVALTNAYDLPLVMLAFKLEVSRYGQLTYVRVYQGTLSKGDTIVNIRTGKRFNV